jgi:hypothetical protein
MGYLNSRSRDTDTPFLAAFHRGLNETGYVAGQNVVIEYRWAEGPSWGSPAWRRPKHCCAGPERQTLGAAQGYGPYMRDRRGDLESDEFSRS